MEKLHNKYEGGESYGKSNYYNHREDHTANKIERLPKRNKKHGKINRYFIPCFFIIAKIYTIHRINNP